LLTPSGKSASTNHSPNKSIGSRSLSETDPLAQVLPPRTRRCRHLGLAAAQILRSSLPCFIFSFFVFLTPIRFPFFHAGHSRPLGFLVAGGPQQGLCFSLAEASAKVHLLLYSAPSTRPYAQGILQELHHCGDHADKREKPRLRKPRPCGFVHPFRAVPKVVHRQQAARHKKS
jgi:hypothetical protein